MKASNGPVVTPGRKESILGGCRPLQPSRVDSPEQTFRGVYFCLSHFRESKNPRRTPLFGVSVNRVASAIDGPNSQTQDNPYEMLGTMTYQLLVTLDTIEAITTDAISNCSSRFVMP